MGSDEAALTRLWREKRGEADPPDLSGNLIVQLGIATEKLNRRWYEGNTGQAITDVQKRIRHPAIRWMAATLDGRLQGSGAVFSSHAQPGYAGTQPPDNVRRLLQPYRRYSVGTGQG